jgi:23S rRNA G2445 N2-methylase RlmL
MARRSPPTAELPPLYAHVQPGLEAVADDEITRDRGGEVKKALRGSVVFRVQPIDEDILTLRTTEDVFLLAWGSDSLQYKATDLKFITQSTAKVKWEPLLALHRQVKGPPPKGKVTYHVVTQMTGEHGYRRVDARDAFKEGLRGKVPQHWIPVDEDADLEFWLTIQGRNAVCGVRLSDKTMRHRTYKTDHIEASLRPTVAAAMVRLAGAGPGMTVLDPFCGAGTILAEQAELAQARRLTDVHLLGVDTDAQALYCSSQNLRRFSGHDLVRGDARRLPFAAKSIDRIVTNPPFGEQLLSPAEIGPLYKAAAREWQSVLKPDGRAVILVSDVEQLRNAVLPLGWQPQRQLKVRVLGQPAVLGVWRPGV